MEKSQSAIPVIVFISIIAAAGAIVLLSQSFAASPFIAVDSAIYENTNLASNADPDAYEGNAVTFEGATDTREFIYGYINPLPGITVGCPGCTYNPEDISVVDQQLPLPLPGTEGLVSLSANRGQRFAVTIDDTWINDFKSEAHVYQESGKWVVDGVKAEGVCVNLRVPNMVLRNSFVNCPTRTQDDTWGYPGQVDDAPAIGVNAAGVTVEYNTITCSGYDENICSRSVWASRDAVVRRNDMSFSRGAVTVTTNGQLYENYMHHYSFGGDKLQSSAGNNPNATHNNGVNLQGYPGITVQRNYIDARYGRTSQNGTKTQYFKDYFGGDGTVSPGQWLNGFGFAFYGPNDTGANNVIEQNYIHGGHRTVACNPSQYALTCGDFSGNLIEAEAWVRNTRPSFHMIDTTFTDQSSIFGNCNRFVRNGVLEDYLGDDDVDAPHRLTSNNCEDYF